MGRRKVLTWIQVALAVLALGAGIYGHLLNPPQGTECMQRTRTWNCYADAAYEAIKLFAANGGGDSKNGWNVLARALGLVFTFSVIFSLLPKHTRRLLARLRLLFFRDHLIVVGLGRKGTALLERSRHQSIVAIDREVEEELEARGARRIVLSGDAMQEAVLKQAKVWRADAVVAAVGDDMVNIQIGAAVARVLEKTLRKGERRARIFVHVESSALRKQIFQAPDSGGRVSARPFSLPDTAARLLLARFPVAVHARDQGAPAANLVLVGFDAHAEALLVAATRLGPLIGQRPPRVTVFASDPKAAQARVQGSFPALRSLASDLDFRPFDPHVALTADELALAEPEHEPVTAIFVHAETARETLTLGLSVRRTARTAGRWRAPLFMRVDDAAPLSSALTRVDETPFAEEVCDVYGELGATLQAVVGREWHEELAQAVHAQYRKTDRASRDDHSLAEADWHEISEQLRDSNRRVVDHYRLKLASSGRIALGQGDMPVLRENTGEGPEPKGLAELEHLAWAREKRLDGWQFGTRRDEELKRHPHLLPYSELSDGVKRKDSEQLVAIERELRSASSPLRPLVVAARARTGTTVFRERHLALIGHNVIELGKAELLRSALTRLLTELTQAWGDEQEFWTLLTPLAPGADVVMAQTAHDFMSRLGAQASRRFRILVVQALPRLGLVEAWRAQPGPEKRTLDGLREVVSCDDVAQNQKHCLEDAAQLELFCRHAAVHYVDLSRPGLDLAAACEPAEQARAHARVEAYLLEHATDLVAALDPGRYGLDTFDASAWAALPETRLPPFGTGSTVRKWLQRHGAGSASLHVLPCSGAWDQETRSGGGGP